MLVLVALASSSASAPLVVLLLGVSVRRTLTLHRDAHSSTTFSANLEQTRVYTSF